MSLPRTRWELAGEGNRGYGEKFGRLVAEGTPAELKAQAGGETLDDVFLALTGHAAGSRDDDESDDLEEIR